jgi:hypothetical protein
MGMRMAITARNVWLNIRYDSVARSCEVLSGVRKGRGFLDQFSDRQLARVVGGWERFGNSGGWLTVDSIFKESGSQVTLSWHLDTSRSVRKDGFVGSHDHRLSWSSRHHQSEIHGMLCLILLHAVSVFTTPWERLFEQGHVTNLMSDFVLRTSYSVLEYWESKVSISESTMYEYFS